MPLDRAEAMRWFTRSAEGGDSEGLTMMGWALLTGEAAPANPPLGLSLLDRAAGQGNANAIGKKGIAYLNGLGVDKDEDAAKRLLTQAAEAGDAASQAALALLLNGPGASPDDLARAVRWARLSATPEHAGGQMALAMVLITHDAVRDMDEGRKRAEQAARIALDRNDLEVATMTLLILTWFFPDSALVPELRQRAVPLIDAQPDPESLRKLLLSPG